MTSLGDIFREAREKKGVSPSGAAEATHIKIQTIEALEQNDFTRIPAAIYAKGFIRIYAEYLGLDPQPLLALYAAGPQPARSARPLSRQAPPPSPAPAPAPAPAAPPAAPAPVRGQPELPLDASPARAPEPVAAAPVPEPEPAPARLVAPVPPRPSHLIARPARPAAAAAAPRAGVPAGQLVAAGVSAVAGAGRKLAAAGAACRERIASRRLTVSPEALRAIVLGAGALLILVLLFSGLSRCSRGRARAEAETSGGPVVPLSQDPLEPYLPARLPSS